MPTREQWRVAREARTRAMWKRYDEDGLTLAQVGAEFGIGKERVRQLFAMAKLPRRRGRGRSKPT